MPFLTDIDSRAKIKGSRDPLGFVPLWARFGRTVVGNLTTVSNSVRGFTTLLLGYHFAHQAQERGSKETTLALFLKFEQLAAYARRSALNHNDFRGVERVTKTLDGKGGRVVLSPDTEHQILSNQRTYGLWGLFSSPARESGLLEQQDTILTAPAEQLVRNAYLAALTKAGDKDGRKLVELLSEKRAVVDISGRHAKLVHAVAELHSPKFTSQERDFYNEHLVQGAAVDRTEGRQRQLSELVSTLPKGESFDMQSLRAIIKMARGRGSAWAPLAEKLEAIRELELLLVPAASAYGFMLSRHGRSIDSVAEEVRSAWGPRLSSLTSDAIAALRPDIARALGDEGALRLVHVAEALTAGRYADALRLLVEHNGSVMRVRGGAAAWIRIEKESLDVRFRDESVALEAPDELAAPWSNTYFLNSLHQVHETLAA